MSHPINDQIIDSIVDIHDDIIELFTELVENEESINELFDTVEAKKLHDLLHFAKKYIKETALKDNK